MAREPPLGAYLDTATPAEATLLENILDVEILHASKVLTEKVIASLHAKQAGVL
jgi:hypothetical protein